MDNLRRLLRVLFFFAIPNIAVKRLLTIRLSPVYDFIEQSMNENALRNE
jgi:hypothetical protein